VPYYCNDDKQVRKTVPVFVIKGRKLLKHSAIGIPCLRQAGDFRTPLPFATSFGLSRLYPVRAGFVGPANEYWYSSANPESPLTIIY
jgi:hypothetical protein